VITGLCLPTTGEVAGTASNGELKLAMAASRQEKGSSQAVGRNLQLVHRRV
jgi:hypothetical protein